MTNYCRRMFLGLPLFVLFLAGGAGAPLFADSEQVIRGEVIMLTSDVCVVKDEGGTSVMLRVDPRTKMTGSVKEGAKVEVHVSPDQLALSIKVLDGPAPVAP